MSQRPDTRRAGCSAAGGDGPAVRRASVARPDGRCRTRPAARRPAPSGSTTRTCPSRSRSTSTVESRASVTAHCYHTEATRVRAFGGGRARPPSLGALISLTFRLAATTGGVSRAARNLNQTTRYTRPTAGAFPLPSELRPGFVAACPPPTQRNRSINGAITGCVPPRSCGRTAACVSPATRSAGRRSPPCGTSISSNLPTAMSTSARATISAVASNPIRMGKSSQHAIHCRQSSNAMSP
jgi:hypothetical protein